MNKLVRIICVAAFLLYGNATHAVSISLDSLNGQTLEYTDLSLGYFSDTYALGAQYSSITSATLGFDLAGTQGLLQTCPIGPGPCTFTILNEAFLSFGSPLALQVFTYGASAHHVIDFKNFTGTTFEGPDISDRLLDGLFELSVSPNSISCANCSSLTVVADASFTITNAVLTVEGTTVPLPSALLFLLSGFAGLAMTRRRQRV